MHKEMQVTECDIANAKNGKASLEDKCLELDSKLVTKLEEIEGLAEQCNQAIKRLKPGIDFRYMINSKGASPPEMLGHGYKTVLKPALLAHAEENKRVTVSNLAESVGLQKQVQGSVKILSLQVKHDEVVAYLNSLDREITNDDSRCAADSRRMKDELEKKYNTIMW